MRAAFAVIASILICLIAAGSYAQSASGPQNVGGEFGRNWISSFKAQNPQLPDDNLNNDLWSWGGAPKGSIIVNGTLSPDPYYVWKSLNYTRGWLGKVYTDPITGYAVYGYIDPYTGMQINFYMDSNTGRPVFTSAYSYYGFPYYGNVLPSYSSYYLPTGYTLPYIFT
jgi:hypothetical protein